jgi:hypothetical protein
MFHVPEQYRKTKGKLASDVSYGRNGAFMIPHPKTQRVLRVIASDETPLPNEPRWEHVSVSLPDRTPIWEEMCFIKNLFWDDEDCVIQFHPPNSEYVNCHPYCLHLWRCPDVAILLPPSIMVGPKP